MGKVIAEITTSVDGYAAGPEVSSADPMGRGGERLHRWLGMAGEATVAEDRDIAAGMFATTGAFVLGRRMVDLGLEHWGEDVTFGRPCMVVTGRPHETIVRGATTFTFVTGGVERAVAAARAAAGEGDVLVAGGPSVVRQAIAAGAVDELRLHVAPLLLGAGTALFEPGHGPDRELEVVRAVTTPLATHWTFRLPG